MARPNKYDPNEMIPIIENYTENEDIPMLKEVCYLNKWSPTYIYKLAGENEELSEAIKRVKAKREVQLFKLGAMNVINPTMAIFGLKQLGWRDKPKDEEEHARELEQFKIIAAALTGKDV